MAVELTKEERNKLMGGPLAAAMAMMAVDMGIFSERPGSDGPGP